MCLSTGYSLNSPTKEMICLPNRRGFCEVAPISRLVLTVGFVSAVNCTVCIGVAMTHAQDRCGRYYVCGHFCCDRAAEKMGLYQIHNER